MHGCGNDYIYVNAMQYPIPHPSAAAIKWSDRHKGIGSDGLVLIDRSPVPEADFSMRIFNADGSEAMMCGNASRCIGKYLYEKGLIRTLSPKDEVSTSSEAQPHGEAQETQIRLLTLSGIKTLYLHIINNKVETVTVDMGEPVLEDESLYRPAIGRSMPILHSDGKETRSENALFVSMGNPHYVIFTDNTDQVGETGRILEHHPAFPQRCNIEFASVTERSLQSPAQQTQALNFSNTHQPTTTIRTRVWERGSGITQACGTGACATAVAAALTGRAGRESLIVMDGGTLSIEWRESDNHVYMTGPAEFVFDGEIEIP